MSPASREIVRAAAGALAAHAAKGVAKAAAQATAQLPYRVRAAVRDRRYLRVQLSAQTAWTLIRYLEGSMPETFSSARSVGVEEAHRVVPGSEGPESEAHAVVDLGYGSYSFRWGGRTWSVSRWREDGRSPDNPFGLPHDRWLLEGYRAGHEDLRALFDAAYDWRREQETSSGDTLRIRVLDKYGDWVAVPNRYPRPVESVVLADGLGASIVAKARAFYDDEPWYRDMGIPHRTGFGFYGPSGTGKTSMADAIASEVGAGLFSVQFTPDLDDAMLTRALYQLPARSVVLMEDLDGVFHGREPQIDGQKLSFSGLLNAIDGSAAAMGRILVVTTNHVGHLDEALVRPGRIDHSYEFELAGTDVALRMFDRFFPSAPGVDREAFGEAYEGLGQELKPAALGVLLRGATPSTAAASLPSALGAEGLGERLGGTLDLGPGRTGQVAREPGGDSPRADGWPTNGSGRARRG